MRGQERGREAGTERLPLAPLSQPPEAVHRLSDLDSVRDVASRASLPRCTAAADWLRAGRSTWARRRWRRRASSGQPPLRRRRRSSSVQVLSRPSSAAGRRSSEVRWRAPVASCESVQGGALSSPRGKGGAVGRRLLLKVQPEKNVHGRRQAVPERLLATQRQDGPLPARSGATLQRLVSPRSRQLCSAARRSTADPKSTSKAGEGLAGATGRDGRWVL